MEKYIYNCHGIWLKHTFQEQHYEKKWATIYGDYKIMWEYTVVIG